MKSVCVLVTCMLIILLLIGENNKKMKVVLAQTTLPLSTEEEQGGGGGGEEEGNTNMNMKPPFELPIPLIPLSPNNGLELPALGLGPEHQRCFASFEQGGMGLTCLQDLGNSFQSQNINLSPDCCSFLNNVDDACKPVLHFQNPVFQDLVKNHCNSLSKQQSSSSSFGDQTGPGTPDANQAAAAASAATSFGPSSATTATPSPF